MTNYEKRLLQNRNICYLFEAGNYGSNSHFYSFSLLTVYRHQNLSSTVKYALKE